MEETWLCLRTRRSTMISQWWDQSRIRDSAAHAGPSQPLHHLREPLSSDRERLIRRLLRRLALQSLKKPSGEASQSSIKLTAPTDMQLMRMLRNSAGTPPICKTMAVWEADRTGLGTS